jgi:cytochrome P450
MIVEFPIARAVINETLRLYPPVPLNVRESRRSSCLLPPSDPTYAGDCRPLYMPGTTTIIYLPLLVQRNKALWGPDADEFDPERWLQPDRIAKFVANSAMFAPFSAGPRIVGSLNIYISIDPPNTTTVYAVYRAKLCLQ